jgi:predicted  nucleic acid-binding Zn-ribbon protein
LTTSKSELEDRLAAAARAQEMSEARLRDQLPLQERRASQMASQTEQLKSLKDELQISNQERLRLETQVANLQSSALSVNYELTLAKTETENLRRQLEQLHADSRDKASHWRERRPH